MSHTHRQVKHALCVSFGTYKKFSKKFQIRVNRKNTGLVIGVRSKHCELVKKSSTGLALTFMSLFSSLNRKLS